MKDSIYVESMTMSHTCYKTGRVAIDCERFFSAKNEIVCIFLTIKNDRNSVFLQSSNNNDERFGVGICDSGTFNFFHRSTARICGVRMMCCDDE